MTAKHKAQLAWMLFGAITVSVLTALILDAANRSAGNPITLGESLWSLVPISFAFVGALIISRQPRNVIGLLLMLPGITFAIPAETYVAQFSTASAPTTNLLLLALWYENWSWLLLIMPILFIMVLFPTGRPLSPRWRWLIYWGLGMSAFLILVVTFVRELGPLDGDWSVANPIGFLPGDWFDRYLATPWFVMLPVLTLFCAASMFVRFRRVRAVEREQMKWLLYACALFAAAYLPTFLANAFNEAGSIWALLFTLTTIGIPISIAMAILRYRLYDIDVIIRKTLVYALLTALLAQVYFGSVLLFQSVFDSLTGEQSPIVIVLSTLLIAALFTPLRRRVQELIDRRFFRKKYDAEQVLAQFAVTARDETDLETLSAELARAATESMHPERVVVWLRSSQRRDRGSS